jgi:antitoxin component HigA of HigAB toxin-antitoxin module
MDATLIVVDSEAELTRAHALIDSLWASDHPADLARLRAQALLIAAYEQDKWPRGEPGMIDRARYLLDQRGLAGLRSLVIRSQR